MNIVFGGKGIHQIENARFHVKAGDVFVIPPMVVHAYYDTAGLDVYHILLHKSFIFDNKSEANAVPGFLQLLEIEPYLRRHFSDAMFLHLTPNQLMLLKNDLDIIEENGAFDKKESIPLMTHTARKILYWLSHLLNDQLRADEKKQSGKYDLVIINLLEYIHRNYGSKLTVDMLCKKAFLSRSTLFRSFTAVCGCTPTEYINRYRCTKALEMIDTTELSKTDIAHACGFYDLSHMERVLKQHNSAMPID